MLIDEVEWVKHEIANESRGQVCNPTHSPRYQDLQLLLENWLGGEIHGQLSYKCCGLCVSVA